MGKINFLDLGKQPIANNFLSSIAEIKNEYMFDLKVVFDDETFLVSLEDFVPPELMFNESYVYYSSLSKTMRDHFKSAATHLSSLFSSEKIMEIGSNDGVFLKNFTQQRAISVEPCKNFAEITKELGYTTYESFWNKDLSNKINTNHGKQDLIFSANCICHIQDLKECFDSVSSLLSESGVFVFEDPSLLKMIQRRSYDQIYDEHAHVFSIIALRNTLKESDLDIFRVENLQVHGGSNRVFACKKGSRVIEDSVHRNIGQELSIGLDSISTYNKFASDVKQSKQQLVDTLIELKRNNCKIVSYGATSKSTTVFNYCGIGTDIIDYIVDTTKEKQGKISPGVHIPVISPEEGFNSTVDYAFLGAWNYEEEISEKERKFLKNGRFISHVPFVRFIKQG